MKAKEEEIQSWGCWQSQHSHSVDWREGSWGQGQPELHSSTLSQKKKKKPYKKRPKIKQEVMQKWRKIMRLEWNYDHENDLK
jgi:hypothetical protein